MSKSICPGELAAEYFVRHPGFDQRLQLGDLMSVLRTREGRRLPPAVALDQRLNDLIRANAKDPKHERGFKIEKWYEHKNGCIRRVFFWMSLAEARRVAAKRMKAAA